MEHVFPVLFGVLAVLLVIPWVRAYRRNELDIFSPVLYKSLFLGATGLELFNRIYLEERRIIRDVSTPFEEGFALILGLYVVLFAAFLTGYYLIGERSISSQLFVPAEATRTTLLKFIAVGYMTAGLLFYCLALYSTIGTDLLYLYQTTTPRSQLFSDSYVYTAGASMLYLGYFLYLVAILGERRLPNIFELLLLPILIGMFFVFGGRATALLIGVTSGIILYYGIILEQIQTDSWIITRFWGSHPIIRLMVLPVVAVAAGLIGIITGAMRGARTVGEAIAEVSPMDVLTVPVQSGRFDNFLLLLDIVPEEVGYYYGSFFLRTFSFLIPRSFWEDKPVSYLGSLIRRVALPDQAGGRPAGEIGSYYLNFGLPGIPVLALAYGIVMKITYSTLQGNRYSPMAILIYAMILTSIGNTGFQNLVMTTLLRDFIILFPALLIHTIIAHRSPKQMRVSR